MWFKRLLLLGICLVNVYQILGQSCPANIGFEDGTLKNWKCYIGTLDRTGQLPINWGAEVSPVPGRHEVIKNSSPQITDVYGQFPINCPNGSSYSLALGNADVSGGAQPPYCERVTYDFVVPDDDFTIIYYYAVVFQNPKDHDAFQQPQFIANLHNLDDPADVSCGSFSFTASAGLEGFQQSFLGEDIYYKPWSPITIRLSGKKGKKYQLEFITRDCSKGGHFGYAYLDFNENCASPITGNNYCSGANSIALTAPAGFEQYQWYDSDGKVLGADPVLKITPPPADGTQYSLKIIPYIGLGCANTFYTTVHKVNEAFNLQVVPDMVGCESDGIDLTQPSVTAGSTPGLKYEYYLDSGGQTFLSDPKRVTATGTYYIRGTNAYGCTDILPIKLTLYTGPKLNFNKPDPACYPNTVDLTKVFTTSETGVTFEYYSDRSLTMPVINPKMIAATGTYYVRALSAIASCPTVVGVNIIVSDLPVVAPLQIKSCPPLNLAQLPDPELGISYGFYADAQGTQPLADPTKITVSGTYYYKGINEYSCAGPLAPIDVTIYPEPDFTVTDPAPVVYPETINLAITHGPAVNAGFSYWKDAKATKPMANYTAADESGTYYIKATNLTECYVINPVHVQVAAPPEAGLMASNTFTPNGDGINDEFSPATIGVININYLKIFNRYGKEVFETKGLLNKWNGTYNGRPEPAGTYYWVFSCYDIYRKQTVQKSGPITIIR